MEIKEIIVPENWEVFIEDGVATFKEKKQVPPRSWEEFCEANPINKGEAYIEGNSVILIADFNVGTKRFTDTDKSWCTSKEEAEAFLALMQLRQLRKAWVGDWSDTDGAAYSIYVEKGIVLNIGRFGVNRVLHFPSLEMAKDFLSCFRDLCETAKILL